MPNRILRDWTDSYRLEQLSAEAERLFVRLIMRADDLGRFTADPRLIKSACFPLLPELTPESISRWLGECEAAGLIQCYTTDGKRLLAIIEFRQRTRCKVGKYPPPRGEKALWAPTRTQRTENKALTKNDRHMTVNRPSIDGLDGDGDGDGDDSHTPGADECEGGVERGELEAPPPEPEFESVVPAPELPEVIAEGVRLMLPADECQNFLDYYAARGWEVNGSKIRNWRAALRVWNSNFRTGKFKGRKHENRNGRREEKRLREHADDLTL